MSRIRARAANNHDHYLNGQVNVLRLFSNTAIKACPVYDNVLLGSQFTLGSNISQAGNKFCNIPGATTSQQTLARSNWAATSDFEYIIKYVRGTGIAGAFQFGVNDGSTLDYSFIFVFDNTGAITSSSASFTRAAPTIYDYLFKVQRFHGRMSLHFSSDCGISWAELYGNASVPLNNATPFYPILYAGANTCAIIIGSTGFEPYTPPVTLIYN
jgi:hypothetical protein